MADLNVSVTDEIKTNDEFRTLNETSKVRDFVVGLMIVLSILVSDTGKVRENINRFMPLSIPVSDTVISVDKSTFALNPVPLEVYDSVITNDVPSLRFGQLFIYISDVVKVRDKLVSGNLTIGMIGPYDIIITIEGKILKHISGIVYMEI